MEKKKDTKGHILYYSIYKKYQQYANLYRVIKYITRKKKETRLVVARDWNTGRERRVTENEYRVSF